MRKFIVAILALFLFASCIRAPNYNGMVAIQTNEIAFLVDMTGDGSVSGGSSAVQRKDIAIPGYWVRTGRFDYQGYWRPEVKVITVSQAPARLDWDQSASTKTIRMTSIESSGFIVPMVVNAYIDSREDAEKYLKAFRPVTNEAIDWSKLSQKEWGPYVKEEAQPLETALNTVVFAKVMEQLSQLFVKTPVLFAEVSSKIYIPAIFNGISANELTAKVKEAGIVNGSQAVVFTNEVQSIKTWAKEQYGITITVMTAGDGVVYDNKDVQTQIDALAAGVMKEKALAQERINAQAEQQVRITKAETERREAEQKQATIGILRQQQEIENSRLIAVATAEGIRNGKIVPAGSYPISLQTLIVTPNYTGTIKP